MDWDGDSGDTKFPDVGQDSGSLCRWIRVVIGVIQNFRTGFWVTV